MPPTTTTAAIVLIGNEILSGRTQDKNLNWMACQLTELGIRLQEVRVIADIEAQIIDSINQLRATHTYIFTTGGIGPTHDDITSASIAKAFNVELIRHPDAVQAMEAYYAPEPLNAARLKMADIPQGAVLITNPVSSAPGFRMDNVYVMAGVPTIMQVMFESLAGELQGGATILSRTLRAWTPESAVAEALGAIQTKHPEVEIGSYPFVQGGQLGTCLVARSPEQTKLNAAFSAITQMVAALPCEYEEVV